MENDKTSSSGAELLSDSDCVGRGKPDANWRSFSIDDKRREKIGCDDASGTVEVNPVVEGKRLLSYHRYLGLDSLLTCQVPSSRVPDERVFIITHQLFELVFKQMIFDLGVISETFLSLLNKNDRDFSVLVEAGEREGSAPPVREFWLPALTAAARVKHGCQDVIPEVMMYLATDETFDNEEFEKGFRPNLSPASGFQSAQFRLIQRAFGKSRLLAVRLFPSDSYIRAYEGRTEEDLTGTLFESENAGLARVVDRLVLQEDTPVATPPAGSPLSAVAELDDLAHDLLARVSTGIRSEGVIGEECGMPFLPGDEDSIKDMEKMFKGKLREAVEKLKEKRNQLTDLTEDELNLIEKRGKIFGEDWARAVHEENARRELKKGASRGAMVLMEKREDCYLRSIFDRLADADETLSEKFLLYHQNLVERRVGIVSGTAGGGVPYLDFARTLVRSFPGLVALRACRERQANNKEKKA